MKLLNRLLKLVPIILVTAMVSAVTSASQPLLPSCPSSPNCVSSLAADTHFIEPLRFTGDAASAFDRLRNILANRSDTLIVAATDSAMQVEFRTFLGFVDDGLLVLDAPAGLIHIRSAARVGYWDMGKNRNRMAEIRLRFQQ
jgi:uncharacterized protein (DUF1499 family)